MKLIIGLGNPGAEYKNTRHNIGFAILDAFAEAQRISFATEKPNYIMAKFKLGLEDVILQKPTTYMNLSGTAIQEIMHFYKISITDIMVVCDDFNIPLGEIRLREKGSDGGQNGLRNTIEMLGKNTFARMRIGIGSNMKVHNPSSFVLSKFTVEEIPIIEKVTMHSCKACQSFIEKGISYTMNHFNKKI